MNCWCGHGPWHYHGYAYPPGGAYGPPPAYYPAVEPPEPYGYGRRRRRRGQGRADADELADYLHELEEEIVRLRRELDELRNSGTDES
ncbi:hypothetical protein IU449_10355 [Nocardia higoensis]|uniref:DUF5320 domain-containing protein n=1 Tax=Nocardia higoensis TaxID=228599 RepID=A0ABS0D970_9NOCA|nr:hypothetical protein [Nocardia higoensis]MBF6354941.1 hypothetical protein [Nocardia higoensis]